MNPPPHRLPENRGLAFPGDERQGRFELTAAEARRLLAARNPHGKPNADVVRRWAAAADLRGVPRDRWMVDFLPYTEEREAALYRGPYARVRRVVRPVWGRRRTAWWIHGRPRPEMRIALAKRERFVATPAAGRPRVFAWLPADVLPDASLVVFARDDDYFFGVLLSRIHAAWMQGAPRYTPAACVETFAFPWPPPTPLGNLTRAQEEQRSAIAEAARALERQRRLWLQDAAAGGTLAQLYRLQPPWLLDLHGRLDEAVAAAYGWPDDLPDAEIVSRLAVLNRERVAAR